MKSRALRSFSSLGLLIFKMILPADPIYKMKIAYAGGPFSGFQSQVDKNAIQDHLERAGQIFLKHPIRIKGASRTDAGVHAEGQVATFRSSAAFDAFRWARSFNALLPPEIRVRDIKLTNADFKPRYALSKVYRYRIHLGDCYVPSVMPYVLPFFKGLDVRLMQEVAKDFIGTHDFRAFCNQDCYSRTFIRKILDVKIEVRSPLINIWVHGESFLKQMVRIMVGTLLEIGMGERPVSSIQNLLTGPGKRQEAGFTAGASGLSLVEIFYEEIPNLSEIMQKADGGYTVAI